jgi:predicted RND superfamily exporter protein
MRARAAAAIVPPLIYDLDRLRKSLAPEMVTIKTLPPNLVRDWVAPDGKARAEAFPKGDANDSNVLRRFAIAVLRAEPTATGTAISYYEAGKTVTSAFVQAGALAIGAIAILLLIALRRVTDVLLTLVPLLLAGVLTLEICVLDGMTLNFANIIALPLLLGVGVAFKIYYIMAWRAGKTHLLQSTLTRAVIFSAMTTAIAFGSMWASSYPGMSSMGKLMALSLLCTMGAAVFFQPVLMGPPRQVSARSESDRDLREAAE